jgi:DNA-binding transcriptional MerR regulator
MSNTGPRLLTFNDPMALRINRDLAAEIGLHESIVLLQLEFLIYTSRLERDGQRWTRKSLRELHEQHFPWWSTATIHRVIQRLADELQLITIANHNRHSYDQTQWFALNPTGLNHLRSVHYVCPESPPDTPADPFQNETPPRPDLKHPRFKMKNGFDQTETSISANCNDDTEDSHVRLTEESPLRGDPAGADARSASPASEQTQPDPPEPEPQPEPEPDRPEGGDRHSAGRAKKSRGRAVAPHPAIALVREATGRQPPPAARETITARVGTSDDDLARWRETITAWQCAGHNPHNITGMLDWYEKREEKREEQRNERTATQPQRKQRQPVAATGAAGGDVARCPEPDIPTGYADLPPEERRRIARERNQRAAARRC